MIIKKFLSYLTFWKKADPNAPHSFNLKMMHGINKISIIMFLFALIVILIRLVRSWRLEWNLFTRTNHL